MKVKKENNILSINGKKIQFDFMVEKVLEFSKCFVVLLMEEEIPDNNVEAFDYRGNKLWNISQIVKLKYPEAYISLSKITETQFSTITYNGVEFAIDIETKQVVSTTITK